MHYLIGFKYVHPPPLPSNHVDRQILLNEIATKLLQATINPNKCEATLTLTGAGGFGKTTIVQSLCYHPLVKECFTDGFVFIELGPQATDPSIKMRAIYNLLTDKPSDINVVEQMIKQLTSDYYHNLLVIIDDVWHVEDAEPLVKAFSNCKTILTTRMNDIEQYIPSIKSVTVGPMTQVEAVSLLTTGLIDTTYLSQENLSLLNNLVQDVHLWPLLLSLIKGQLSHNLKQYHWSYHKAIQNVQAKLHDKGLTALDKNIIERKNKGRKLAVKACIDITLELLTKLLSDKFKSLILYTGIGASLQIAVLNDLWNVSKQEAEDIVNTLWGYNLVKYTDIIIPIISNTQHCVEVHAVISQYIIESMDSNEFTSLSPFSEDLKTATSVKNGLIAIFKQSYGIHYPVSLTAMDHLKYKQNEIEHVWLPYYLRMINMRTVTEPHAVIIRLQEIRKALMTSPYIVNLLAWSGEEIDSLVSDCRRILRDAYKLCRKLNQGVDKSMHEQSYDKLIQTVKEFCESYPLPNVAQKAVAIVKSITPYCDSELLDYVMMKYEHLQMMTPEYYQITLLVLPFIKLYVKLHKEITKSLLVGFSNIEQTYYYMSGKFDEERQSVIAKYLIKTKEVAPIIARQQVSQLSLK